MKTSHPRRHLAILNELTLQGLQSQQTQSSVTTLSEGIHVRRHPVINPPRPEQLLLQAIAQVKHAGLQRLLSAVVSEPEVQAALLTPCAATGNRRSDQPSYPVEALRRAADLASYWCVLCQQEREVLFVATFIQGLGSLLAPYVVGPANLNDILFTLVRPALHRLDYSSPLQGQLLRLVLGWGNVDEVDSCYVPGMVQAVKRALLAVGISG